MNTWRRARRRRRGDQRRAHLQSADGLERDPIGATRGATAGAQLARGGDPHGARKRTIWLGPDEQRFPRAS